MFSQAVYLHVHRKEKISDSYSTWVKSGYIVGLVSPLLDWLFFFYLIRRVNKSDKRRSGSNPNFLDTEDNELIDDNDGMVIENTSAENNPVFYEDFRRDYSRPLDKTSQKSLSNDPYASLGGTEKKDINAS